MADSDPPDPKERPPLQESEFPPDSSRLMDDDLLLGDHRDSLGTLEHPSEAHESSEPLSGPKFRLPTQAVWPFLVFVVLGLAIGGYFAWRALTAPEPLKVLIAIDVNGQWWEGSKPAAELVDALAQQLEAKGFDPVKSGDPTVTKILEEADSPLDAARELGAAFVIEAKLEPTVESLPMEGGFYEMRLSAPLIIRYSGDDRAFSETPIDDFAAARSEERALELVTESLRHRMLDATLPVLMKHETIVALLDGADPGPIGKLSPAKKYITHRTETLEDQRAAYKRVEDDRVDGERGPRKTRFASERNASEKLCAVTDKGLLVNAAAMTSYLSPDHDMLPRAELETLEMRPPGSTSGVTLWRGYNAFTYASAPWSGTPVVVVEDIYDFAHGVVLVDEDHEPRRIRMSSEVRYSEPRVSPDGKSLALIEKTCRRCDREIVVLDLQQDQAPERFRLAADVYDSLGGFNWLDGEHLLVVYTPVLALPEDGNDPVFPKQTLWKIEVATGRREVILEASSDYALGYPKASHDGKHVAVSLGWQQRALLTIDLDAMVMKRHALQGQADSPEWSPDGKLLTFEYELGVVPTEIGLLDVATSKFTRLTNNNWKDRFPQFSRDGISIYFEARNRDPIYSTRREVMRVASVSVSP